MRYDLKLIYKVGDDSYLEKIIFDGRYEVRRDDLDSIYDARYKDKLAINVPEYMFADGIQNIIKNVWKS
jgi:hypothetical protein